MKRSVFSLSLFILFIVTVCGNDPHSSRGFSLPVGDISKGALVFRESKCLSCHSLEGFEDESLVKEVRISTVKLGGKVSRVKTYAELITSIINPSHKLATGYAVSTTQTNGQSKMHNYNNTMTVSQLIDLVTFLESHYELRQYQHTRYNNLYPGL